MFFITERFLLKEIYKSVTKETDIVEEEKEKPTPVESQTKEKEDNDL